MFLIDLGFPFSDSKTYLLLFLEYTISSLASFAGITSLNEFVILIV